MKFVKIVSDFELPGHILLQLPKDVLSVFKQCKTQLLLPNCRLNIKGINTGKIPQFVQRKVVFACGAYNITDSVTLLSFVGIDFGDGLLKKMRFEVDAKYIIRDFTETPLIVFRRMYIYLKLKVPFCLCSVCNVGVLFQINKYIYCQNEKCSESHINFDARHLSFGDDEILVPCDSKINEDRKSVV